jgi:PAS domain S-box-containing protein
VRILIVDDHAPVRRGIRGLLTSRSDWLICGEAVDGHEAVSLARDLRPDVILMDISMPRLGGLEATRIIRRELPEAEIIIVSQNDPDIVERQSREVYATSFLSKSDLAHELIPEIERVLTSRAGSSAPEAPSAALDASDASGGDAIERRFRLDAEMLAAIVASSDDAIVSKDLDGVITTWNKGAERIFGYTAEEAIGRHITLIVPPDRRDEEAGILARIRRGERVDHIQTVRVRKDGSSIDVSATISPLKDASGKVIGASKVARDITSQRRSEQELRESEERFRAIVETTPECVKLVAADGTILHMNAPGLRMVGATSADAVVGKNIYDLLAPGDRERFRAFNESVCRGRRGSIEFDIIGLDGTRRRMETHAAPLRNPDGTVALLSVTRDVTERKASQAALLQSEQRLRSLVNASSYAVYRMSADCKVMHRLDGRGFVSDIENAATDWMERYVHPDDRVLVAAKIDEAIRSKSLLELEHRVLRSDGSFGWALSRAIPILDADGDIVEWFGTASDVTRRKQAEEDYRGLTERLESEVHARTAELEERNTDLLTQSDRLRNLSLRIMQVQDDERRHIARELHDSAGQTLTVLGINLAQIIHLAGQSDPPIAAKLAETQTILEQLTREIRTTSYLLHPPLLDEGGLAPALTWYVQGLTERSNLEIDLCIPEDLGRLPRDRELAIFRVVQESLANILRHSGSKKAAIRITRGDSSVSVAIQDFGSGMPPEKLSAIQSHGSGVGIRGMRERIHQLNGEMKIESSDSGTTVSVSLPVPAGFAAADAEQPRTLEAAG